MPSSAFRFLCVLCTWIIVAAVSCSDTTDVATAEKSVARFREDVKNGNFQVIVNEASLDFQKAVNGDNRRNFEMKLDQFHLEIGNSNNFELSGQEERYDAATGKLIILRYRGLRNNKVLSEEYVFKLENNAYRLFNYEFKERTE